MPADQELSGAKNIETKGSAKAKNSATSPPGDVNRAVTSTPSTQPTNPDESKPSDGCDAAAVLTGSLNDLALKGHFLDTRPPERKEDVPKETRQDNICVNCFGPATRRCCRCNSSWYCSSRCQKADHKYHRHLCSQLWALRLHPQPWLF